MTVFLHNLTQSFRPFNLSAIKRFLSTDYKLTLKRVFILITFYLLTAVLLFSGIAKIIDPLPLLNTLKQITFLPTQLQIIIATLLPVVEIGLAVLMLMKIKPKLTLTAVAVLFAAFLGFSIMRGRNGMKPLTEQLEVWIVIAGACPPMFKEGFGDVVKSSFGWGMILRTTVFFVMSLITVILVRPDRNQINNI